MHDDPRDDDFDTFRALLVRDEHVPLGMLSRLEVRVVRAARRRAASLGWEARLVVSCLAFIVLGSGAMVSLTPAVAGVLGVLAIIYPWAALRVREES